MATKISNNQMDLVSENEDGIVLDKPAGAVSIGDYEDVNNGVLLVVDDANTVVSAQAAGNTRVVLNHSPGVSEFGDTEGASSGAVIKVYAVTGLILLNSSVIQLGAIPTSDPAVAGQLWNDAGTLKVSAG